MRMFVVAALIILSSTFANADVRSEAINTISSLRDFGIAQKMPDEMNSIDTTFITAEKYFHLNDRENADRYFLLTIQKAQVISTILLDNTSHAHASSPQPPEDPQKAGTSDSTSHKTAPSSAKTTGSVTLIQSEPIINNQLPTTGQNDSAGDINDDYYYVTSENIVGKVNTYIVRKNDTLRLVAAKLGVSRQHLAQVNHLDIKASLKIGQKLKYNNRKIVPQRMKNGIVINIPDRTLYYFRKGKLAVSMPVALGTARKTDKYDWKTPTGKFKVTAKQKDPTWYVPYSIQSEMEDEGKEILTSVPPGPNNPLGKYAIKTSIPGILIHSTTKPGSIYSYASHGCIRANPEHMEGLFNEIKVNTLGEIIYRPIKLAVTEDGQIFLEVHQDVYGKNPGLDAEARRLIEKQNLSGRVNWTKVKLMLKLKAGIAEDITL